MVALRVVHDRIYRHGHDELAVHIRRAVTTFYGRRDTGIASSDQDAPSVSEIMLPLTGPI